ncbi:T9SS type A sorting domain-containing protein [Chryseobacterium shigense]|uniref:Putative delta-60 repeat protein n=1 Tax=Chryseobacterium shigense TaxID=297244 RepID=A0A841N617_9FLAO|nr:T9SS type A sorting domain-containing protein [Chryseobacterium shigense]MBB6370151.1 putative delta-60 repeat protein [Chryseobacterium shigense]
MKKFFISFTLITAFYLNAQTVTADSSFGSNGFSVLSNQTDGDSVISSVVQPDGKVIISGQRINGANSHEVFISRLNADGTTDTTFANNGYFTSFQYPDAYVANLYLMGNKILIFYPAQNTLIKLNPDGTLDSSFGVNGVFTIASGTNYSNGSVLLSNYLYIGKTENSQGVLQKIDVTAGNIVSTANIPGISNIYGVYNGPGGKLLVKSINNQTYTTYLTLLNTDGTIDSTFGTNGTINTASFSSLADYENSYDYVTLDDAGNIIHGISNENSFTTSVKKYTPAGSVMTTFANNGTYQLANTIISGLKTFSNQIYLSGASIDGSINIMVARLNPNGTPDNSFNNNGIFVGNTNAYQEWAESFNVISPTTFFVAGEINNGTNNNIYAAKFNLLPTLSTTEAHLSNSVFFENPVKSNVIFQANEKINKIEIYSADGKHLRTIKENDTNVSDLPKGIYIAKTELQNGKVVVKKLIKQ